MNQNQLNSDYCIGRINMKLKINNEEYEQFTKAISKKDIKKVKSKDIPRDENGNIDFSKCADKQDKKDN